MTRLEQVRAAFRREPVSVGELAERLGIRRDNVKHLLRPLLAAGEVERVGYGVYRRAEVRHG